MPRKSNKLIIILGGVVLYLASAGISFAAFRYLNQPAKIVQETSGGEKKSGFKVDVTGPKTEACPLNGGMFTQNENFGKSVGR
jgi:flagellar basal body-associated protein FliL